MEMDMRIAARARSIGIATALFASALAAGPRATAQEKYTPTPANLEARIWFQDAKFGMFIHWGVYSVLGDGEWIMETRPINRTDYAKVPAFFNPIKFDPAAWVALAKAAGMKYITITSKHHDGFAMFDSRLTDWNVVARTPYGKDVIGMLAAECHKQGIKLFLYHSQLDWHSPDYFPRGRTGHHTDRPDSGNWDAYLNFMDGQLRELLTNYGEIGGIWFDGMWDKPDADWHLARTYALIHQLQPQAMVGSNHHKNPFPGEDFQMFEKDLPGQHTTGFNPEQSVSALPLETAETMNNSWGFNLTDEHYKSPAELIRYLVRAAGSNANFLLNVGPMPSGEIQPEFVQRLRGAMDEAVWRFGLRNARRASDGGAVGRDDATGLDGLRSRPGLEWSGAGATGDAAAGSYGEAAARWEQCRIQRRQWRTGAETAGAETGRSGSRDCS
jgi:alpha-L-fucosidase